MLVELNRLMQRSSTGRFLSIASCSSLLVLLVAGTGAVVPSAGTLLATSDVNDDRGSGRISPTPEMLKTSDLVAADLMATDAGYRGSGRVDPHTPSVDANVGTVDWRGSGRLGQGDDQA